MPVIMLPKPEEMVDTVSMTPRPPMMPMYRQAMTMPMEALSFRTMMHTRMMAIAITRCRMSSAGDTIVLTSFLFCAMQAIAENCLLAGFIKHRGDE